MKRGGKLRPLPAREVVRRLKKVGFVEDEQRESHLRRWRPTDNKLLIVPIHPGEFAQRDFKRDHPRRWLDYGGV